MPTRASIDEMLEAHSRWVETDGREGRPADLTGMDLRGMTSLSYRALTALIAPGAVFYGLDLSKAARCRAAICRAPICAAPS